MSAVLWTEEGAVCTITINRPEKRNAVDRIVAQGLRDAYHRFEKSDHLRVAVLTGAGGVFCAGADLSAVSDPLRKNELDPTGGGDGPMGPSRIELSKPLIAAIEGYAVAGGLELALQADMRIADPEMHMGVFCRRWGVPLIDGGTVRLPRLVGMGRALDLILTGREVRAEEALQMGLVNRISMPGKALATAVELAHQIAEFPNRCMLADRQSVYEQWNLSLSEALRNEGKKGTPIVALEGVNGAGRFSAGEGRHGAFSRTTAQTR